MYVGSTRNDCFINFCLHLGTSELCFFFFFLIFQNQRAAGNVIQRIMKKEKPYVQKMIILFCHSGRDRQNRTADTHQEKASQQQRHLHTDR